MATTALGVALMIGWSLYFVMSRPEPEPPTPTEKESDQ